MKKAQILDLLGWAGTALILGGYGLFTLGIVPDIMVYHVLNCLGSLGVIVISSYKKVWQPVVINGFMAFFAITAIIRHYL